VWPHAGSNQKVLPHVIQNTGNLAIANFYVVSTKVLALLLQMTIVESWWGCLDVFVCAVSYRLGANFGNMTKLQVIMQYH
jgi:hypothetical protein